MNERSVTAFFETLAKVAAKLSADARDALPEGVFALPGRRYPVHDASHARAALSMVTRHGTPSERAIVRDEVARRYPGIGVEKIAKTEDRKGPSPVTVGLGSLGLGLGLNTAAALGHRATIRGARTPRQLDLFEKLRQNSDVAGVPVRPQSASVDAGGITAFYNPVDHEIAAVPSQGPHTLAHEMGHSRGTWGRKLLQPVVGVSRGMSGMMMLPSAIYGGYKAGQIRDAKTSEEVDKAQRGLKTLGVVGAAVSAPMVFEELRANMRVPKLLREAGAGWGEVVGHSAKLLPALGTYLTLAAMPAIPYLLAKSMSNRKRQELGGKPKTAEMNPKLKQFLKNTAIIGVGAGLGAGAGWGAKKGLLALARRFPAIQPAGKYLPPAMAVLGGGATLFGAHKVRQRQKLLEETVSANLQPIKGSDVSLSKEGAAEPSVHPGLALLRNSPKTLRTAHYDTLLDLFNTADDVHPGVATIHPEGPGYEPSARATALRADIRRLIARHEVPDSDPAIPRSDLKRITRSEWLDPNAFLRKEGALGPKGQGAAVGTVAGGLLGAGTGGLANLAFGLSPKKVALTALGGALVGAYKGRQAGRRMLGEITETLPTRSGVFGHHGG